MTTVRRVRALRDNFSLFHFTISHNASINIFQEPSIFFTLYQTTKFWLVETDSICRPQF